MTALFIVLLGILVVAAPPILLAMSGVRLAMGPRISKAIVGGAVVACEIYFTFVFFSRARIQDYEFRFGLLPEGGQQQRLRAARRFMVVLGLLWVSMIFVGIARQS